MRFRRYGRFKEICSPEIDPEFLKYVIIQAALIGFGNNSVSLIAGITIFSTVFALSSVDAMQQVSQSGPANTGLTFIYLPILFTKLSESNFVNTFFATLFFIRFMGESLSNMISAFLWPVEIVQWRPPIGAIILGAAFMLFPIYVKPYITAWLFPDGEPEDDKGEPGGAQRK